MKHYAGLDVSNKTTSICIMNEKRGIEFEAVVPTDPKAIGTYLKETKLSFETVGLETGSLSHWLISELEVQGWPIVLLDAKKAAPILKADKVNKTDKNDARGLANILRTENLKPLHHKSKEAVELGTILQARQQLVESKTKLQNCIRGLLKTYGKRLDGTRTMDSFHSEVLRVTADLSVKVQKSIVALLTSLDQIWTELKKLEFDLEKDAEADEDLLLFQTVPGVGPITAMAFKAEMDVPGRFANSRDVPAYFGLTPSQYSSGDTCIQGGISKQGSTQMRWLLVGAAISILTHVKQWSKIKAWGTKLQKKKSTKKAAVAMARKLAMILHRMWITKEAFRPGTKPEKSAKKECKAA